MKDKIKAYLKTKLGNHAGGVQDAFLDGIAEAYSPFVTEEAQIATTFTDGVIQTLKFTYDWPQPEIDRRVGKAEEARLKKWRDEHGLDEDGNKIVKPEDKKKAATTNEEPSYIKEIREQNEALRRDLDAIKKEKKTESLRSQILAKLKAKEVDEDWIGSRPLMVESEDQIDQLVETLSGEYTAYAQKMAEKGVFKAIPKKSSGGVKESETLGKRIAEGKNNQVSEGIAVKKLD